MMGALCTEPELAALMTAVAKEGDDLVLVDRMLAVYPQDARLHFLRGSVLAGIGRSIEALAALKEAVSLAPDFAIARFQLGFFQLTSGEAADALSSWGPLAMLPADHYLRLFVGGLTYLIRDEFGEALAQLRAGMAANRENAPLNHDIQLIVDRIGDLDAQERGSAERTETASATSVLLGQFTPSGRPN